MALGQRDHIAAPERAAGLIARRGLDALGFDGARREKLLISVVDGQLRIQVDLAALAAGPTPFFELVRD